jgi:hypothetical protein
VYWSIAFIGGDDILEDYQCGDISGIFIAPGFHRHSQSAHKMLEKLQIGVLEPDEIPQPEVMDLEDSQPAKAGINFSAALWSQVSSLSSSEYHQLLSHPTDLKEIKVCSGCIAELLSSRLNIYSIWLWVLLVFVRIYLIVQQAHMDELDPFTLDTLIFLLCGLLAWHTIEIGLFVSLKRITRVFDCSFVRQLHLYTYGSHILAPESK